MTVGDNTTEYTSLADDLIRVSGSSDYGNDLLSYSYLIKLLVYVNRLYKESTHFDSENLMPKIIMDTMDYVNEHFSEKITLDDLSELLNYNGNYISNCFKQYTGLTLRNYILNKRIDYAGKLLLSGASVSDACIQSGFNDYANFIRNFKRVTGVSPGKYGKESFR